MANNMNLMIKVLVFLLVFLLSACDIFTDSATRLSRAEAYQGESNHQAAIIELKKALESDSGNAQARLLLGHSYSWLGQWANAEKEYRRAAKLGANEGQYLTPLGKSMLAQNRFQPLLDELTETEEASAELLSLRGEAYIALNQSNEAKRVYEQLLQKSSSKQLGLVGLAKTELADGQVEAANTHIVEALDLVPDSIDSLLIKGQIEFVSSRFDQAEQVFAKALTQGGGVLPRVTQFSVLGGLVESQLQQGKSAEAKKNIAVMARQFSGHPRTKYFVAMMDYEAGKYEQARDGLLAAMKVAPNFLPAQILMGAVNYQLGNYEQADSILTAVLSSNPNNKRIRKLLVATRLKHGQPDEVMEVLDPSLEAVAGDSDLLLMAGRAKIQSGDKQAGIALLEQGAEQFPQSTELQMGLASAYLGAGQLDRAISSLDSIVTEGDEAYKRNAMLVFAHVQNKEMDKALAFLDGLLREDPENAQTHILMGAVYSLDKTAEMEKAFEHFNKALSLAPENVAALMGLGRLEIQADKLDDAQARFAEVHALNPKHVSAIFALAHIAEQNKQPDKAVEWLVKAVNVNPAAQKPKGILFRYLFKHQDYQGLEVQTRSLIKQDAKDTVAINALVLSLLKQNKLEEALLAVNEGIKLQPQEASLYYSAGRIYSEQGELVRSNESYQKVLEINPTHQAAIIALIEQKEKAGEIEYALKLIDGYQQREPNNIFSYVMLGNLMQRQGEHDKALPAFNRAVALAPNNFGLLSKLYQVKRALSDASIVDDLQAWLGRHPDDTRVGFMLAEHYQGLNENDKAIAMYEKVIALQAENYVALNNLAWLYYLKDDKRALATAESAHKLKSDDASIEDTLAWIMIKEGRFDQGVELLRSAVSRAPNVGDLQYHLAYGLHKQGHAGQAKAILKKLLESNERFGSADEARKLYQSL